MCTLTIINDGTTCPLKTEYINVCSALATYINYKEFHHHTHPHFTAATTKKIYTKEEGAGVFLYRDGVGTGKFLFDLVGLARGQIYLKGISKNLDKLFSKKKHGFNYGDFKKVNIVGFSRGAVQSIMDANYIVFSSKWKNPEVNIFNIDPVPGWPTEINPEGYMGDYKGMTTKYEDFRTLPSIVKRYMCILALHDRKELMRPIDHRRTHYKKSGGSQSCCKLDRTKMRKGENYLLAHFMLLPGTHEDVSGSKWSLPVLGTKYAEFKVEPTELSEAVQNVVFKMAHLFLKTNGTKMYDSKSYCPENFYKTLKEQRIYKKDIAKRQFRRIPHIIGSTFDKYFETIIKKNPIEKKTNADTIRNKSLTYNPKAKITDRKTYKGNLNRPERYVFYHKHELVGDELSSKKYYNLYTDFFDNKDDRTPDKLPKFQAPLKALFKKQPKPPSLEGR